MTTRRSFGKKYEHSGKKYEHSGATSRKAKPDDIAGVASAIAAGRGRVRPVRAAWCEEIPLDAHLAALEGGAHLRHPSTTSARPAAGRGFRR